MIKRIVILIGTEDAESIFTGAQVFIKNPKDYIKPLRKAIKDYYAQFSVSSASA